MMKYFSRKPKISQCPNQNIGNQKDSGIYIARKEYIAQGKAN